MTRSSIRQLLRSTQFEPRDNKLVRDALVAAAGARFNDEALGKISSAIELMEKEHRGQTRKGTNAPYAIHPNRIALSILEGFGKVDSEVICAALLHDLIEDAGISPETLAQHFGRRCADLVVTLTRQPGEQRDEDGDRLEGPYLQRIIQAGDDAVLLKAADKLDNLRDAAYHPDSERVNLWVRETYSAYIPLVRSISDRQLCARAEKLLLEAVAQTGDPESPEFLASLLASICYSLTVNSDATTELTDIALPEIATKLYLYLNPEAQYWLDSDGTSVFATRTSHLQLAIRIAQSLRELIVTGDLELLLNLAGLPGAFASGENRRFWKRTASVLVFIQRLLREPGKYKWFEVLTSETNLPLLLALIQSRLYLPASWRSPLWATNLGATLSRRVSELSPCPASTLLSQVLSSRLALTRYLQGTGTLSRTEPILITQRWRRFRRKHCGPSGSLLNISSRKVMI